MVKQETFFYELAQKRTEIFPATSPKTESRQDWVTVQPKLRASFYWLSYNWCMPKGIFDKGQILCWELHRHMHIIKTECIRLNYTFPAYSTKLQPCSNNCNYLQWSQVWQAQTLCNKRDQGKANIIYVIIISCLLIMKVTLSKSGYLSQRWNNNNALWSLRGDVKQVFKQTALCSSTAKNSDLYQLRCWYTHACAGFGGCTICFLKRESQNIASSLYSLIMALSLVNTH